jgi:lysophospholipase L1-like esterase
VAFGDSITNGGDATRPELIFWRRWVDGLRQKYPSASITAVNGATGGDTITRGLQRLQARVIDVRPDLVVIGFGMNDHNTRGVPLPDFERQLTEMITRIRTSTSAEIVVCSTFPPNPRWTHGSQRMAEYAAATAGVAGAMRCAYADVFSNWQTMMARKKPEDILANNINHPNDFGHWIYYRVFDALGL